MYAQIINTLLLFGATLVFADGPVIKTGQTHIYHTGDDGAYQSGKTRSYLRDDAIGIVIDDVTHLQWQDNTTVQKPWITQENSDAGRYGDTSGDTATTYCSELDLGGHDDWRMPSVKELSSILNMSNTDPAFDPIFRTSMADFYYTSNTNSNPDKAILAWGVHFEKGLILPRLLKNTSQYVRCVRGNTMPASTYIRDQETKTVYDAQSGLTWQDNGENSADSRTWGKAIEYCEDLDLADLQDWRLPNYFEIAMIIDTEHQRPAIDPIFQNIPSSVFYSSTTQADVTTNAWVINTDNGDGKVYEKAPIFNIPHALCVRTGAITSPNRPPKVTSTPLLSVSQGSVYGYTPTGIDLDSDPLAWSVKEGSTLPTWLSLQRSAYQPEASQSLIDSKDGKAIRPSGIFLDRSGDIYVGDTENNRIVRWTLRPLEGSTVAGGNGYGPNSDQFKIPIDISVHTNGDLYIVDYDNNRVQRWSPGARSAITVAGGNGYGPAKDQLARPHGVFVDSDENVYVADTNNHRIQRWAPGADHGVTVAGGNGQGDAADQLSYPHSIFMDTARHLYISDTDNHRVQRWTVGANDGMTIAGGNGQGNAADQLSDPYDIFVDSHGDLYIADHKNHRIQKWIPGAITASTVAGRDHQGSDADRLDNPISVYVDESRHMYVSDTLNQRIQIFDPLQTLTGTPTKHDIGVYDINLTLSDGHSEVAHDFQIKVAAANIAPTDITFTDVYVNENNSIGSSIIALASIDADDKGTHIYNFCGGLDDKAFSLNKTVLMSAVIFDYEKKNSYSICLRSTNKEGASFDKDIRVLINDI